MNNIEILEELSDNEHNRWANWQKYVHSKCIKNKDGSLTIPKEYVDHWNYEINTEYKDLPENIKESDRKEARKILETLNYKNLIKENKELKEYKKIAELTKISCCTAQNCEALNNAIKNGLENEKLIQENKELNEKRKDGTLSDGYHTYNDLYYQRCVLFATICNLNKDISWKSKKHSDGKKCFDSDNWFIVGIDTPEGSYTYHYEMKYWDMFNVKELEVGKIWDGHTEKDVTRLLTLEEGE